MTHEIFEEGTCSRHGPLTTQDAASGGPGDDFSCTPQHSQSVPRPFPRLSPLSFLVFAMVEPSPPPPPWPQPPEPSPPSLHPLGHIVLGSLLSGEQVFDLGDLEVHRGITNGPDVLLHSIVSMMSAVVLLVLACSLRVQAQPRRRAPVANAYPVMLAYGMVPTSEMTIATSEDLGEVGIPVAVGQRIDLIMQPIAPVVDARESFEESSSVAPERVSNPRREEG